MKKYVQSDKATTGEEEQATTGARRQDGAVGLEQRQRSGRRKQKGENGGKSPSRENLTQPIAAVRNDDF